MLRSSRTSCSRLLSLVLLGAFVPSIAILPRVAHAEPPANDVEKAKLLYNEGLDLRDIGDHKGALLMFQAAFRHVPSPIIGLDLARAHEKLGQLVEALEVATAVGKMPIVVEETPKSAGAREEAAKMAKELPKRIASVKIAAPADPDATVTIDGVVVPASELGSVKQLNPGKHVIVLRSGPEVRREVELGEGENKELSLAVEKKSHAAEPTAPGREHRPTNWLAVTGFTAAGVGLVFGSITGFIAFSKTSTLSSACASNGVCPPGQEDNIRLSRTMGNLSTVFFIIGGVGAGVGIVGLLRGTPSVASPPKSGSITPWIGVGSVGVSGAF